MAKIMISAFALTVSIAACATSALARRPLIKRTDLATAEQSETETAYMWVADIAPGSATGRHTHPTPRFVYVVEGSVVLEMDGMLSHTFNVGEGFVEVPGQVHNFRNASASIPAKALGFQVVPNGMPLQKMVE